LTPDERILQAGANLDAKVAADLVQRINERDPMFLEQVLLQLMAAWVTPVDSEQRSGWAVRLRPAGPRAASSMPWRRAARGPTVCLPAIDAAAHA